MTLYLPSIARKDAAFQPTDLLNRGTRFHAQNVEFRTGEAEVFRSVQPKETLLFDYRGVWRFDAADWMSGNWNQAWSVECQIRCYHAFDYYRAEILLLDELTAIEMAGEAEKDSAILRTTQIHSLNPLTENWITHLRLVLSLSHPFTFSFQSTFPFHVSPMKPPTSTNPKSNNGEWPWRSSIPPSAPR